MDFLYGIIIVAGLISVINLILSPFETRCFRKKERELYYTWRAKADEANEKGLPEPLKPAWLRHGWQIEIINWKSKKDEGR